MYREKTFKVVEGDLLLKIACKVTGSPKPIITWKKDGRNIALGEVNFFNLFSNLYTKFHDY